MNRNQTKTFSFQNREIAQTEEQNFTQDLEDMGGAK